MLPNARRSIVPFVLDQHAADLAILWATRRDHVRAPRVALRHLRRVDDRIAAHLDGCAVAGGQGMRMLIGQFVDPAPGVLFAATAVALEIADVGGFNDCVTVADSLPKCAEGIVSALGWIGRDRLSGIGMSLLEDAAPFRGGCDQRAAASPPLV